MRACIYICIYKSYKKGLKKEHSSRCGGFAEARSCLWWLAGTAEHLCYRLTVSGCIMYGSCPYRSVHFLFLKFFVVFFSSMYSMYKEHESTLGLRKTEREHFISALCIS